MNGRADSRRRRIFAVVYAVAVVAITVPVIPAVWAAEPLVLGLPPSLVWMIAWLAVSFGLVLWLYRTEPDHRAPGDRR